MGTVTLLTMTVSEVKQAVDAFNARYGEMEKALWCLSRAAASAILERSNLIVVEQLVWTIKSWWGIQGVTHDIKTIAAQALLALKWEPTLFAPCSDVDSQGETFAVERVAGLVHEMRKRGARRYEWSLASKVLHWLMPWRIPVYDGFVKRCLCISEDEDHYRAYQRIVRFEFQAASRLLQQGQDWLGDIEPRAPFRALDKYLWWWGGGNTGQAVIVSDPWRVVRSLGLRVC